MVVTATGKYAYQREDGIYVIPIGCLKNQLEFLVTFFDKMLLNDAKKAQKDWYQSKYMIYII